MALGTFLIAGAAVAGVVTLITVVRNKLQSIVGNARENFSTVSNLDFTGMSENALEEITRAINTYIEKLEAILETYKNSGIYDSCFKGEIKEGVEIYNSAIIDLLKAYITAMRQNVADMKTAYDSYHNLNTELATAVASDAEAIRNEAKNLELDVDEATGIASSIAAGGATGINNDGTKPISTGTEGTTPGGGSGGGGGNSGSQDQPLAVLSGEEEEPITDGPGGGGGGGETPSSSDTPVVDPIKPIDPTEPVTPTDPSKPDTPTEPTTPTDPSKPDTPTEPTTPVDPSKPDTPTEPTTPTGPTDPSNPNGGGGGSSSSGGSSSGENSSNSDSTLDNPTYDWDSEDAITLGPDDSVSNLISDKAVEEIDVNSLKDGTANMAKNINVSDNDSKINKGTVIGLAAGATAIGGGTAAAVGIHKHKENAEAEKEEDKINLTPDEFFNKYGYREGNRFDQ